MRAVSSVVLATLMLSAPVLGRTANFPGSGAMLAWASGSDAIAKPDNPALVKRVADAESAIEAGWGHQAEDRLIDAIDAYKVWGGSTAIRDRLVLAIGVGLRAVIDKVEAEFDKWARFEAPEVGAQGDYDFGRRTADIDDFLAKKYTPFSDAVPVAQQLARGADLKRRIEDDAKRIASMYWLESRGIPKEAYPMTPKGEQFWTYVLERLDSARSAEDLKRLIDYVRGKVNHQEPDYRRQADVFLKRGLAVFRERRAQREKEHVVDWYQSGVATDTSSGYNFGYAIGHFENVRRSLGLLAAMGCRLETMKAELGDPKDPLESRSVTLADIRKDTDARLASLRSRSSAQSARDTNLQRNRYAQRRDSFLRAHGASAEQRRAVGEHGVPQRVVSGPARTKIWLYLNSRGATVKRLQWSGDGRLIRIWI